MLSTININKIILIDIGVFKDNIFFFISRLCGLDIQTQAAFELAAQGLLRPANSNIPMIYNIKCVDFTSPEFTLGKYSIF